MESQIRNFKDFLQLYNKVTELCFTRCVDNFFNRGLDDNELACVDKCVTKFASFNQKMMGVYVEIQTDINQKRMAELEVQARQQQQQEVDQNKEIPALNSTEIVTGNISVMEPVITKSS